MDRRIKLHHLLEKILGSKNVYYDPPEDFKLTYPCIVYFQENNAEWHADNRQYHRAKRYSLTYITRKADDPMVDQIDEQLLYCSLNRSFTTSNLHHHAYTLFY